MGIKRLSGERILFTWRAATDNNHLVILLELELEESLEGRSRVIREALTGGEAPLIVFRYYAFQTESALNWLAHRSAAKIKPCAIFDGCTLAGGGCNFWTLCLLEIDSFVIAAPNQSGCSKPGCVLPSLRIEISALAWLMHQYLSSQASTYLRWSNMDYGASLDICYDIFCIKGYELDQHHQFQ